ncbi:DUF2239 family protein [Deinococcus pimensis]|uniref:DUF2239 family protein n=1 Tax=Deinococcus pimensis TaxID=309888 RepID=UPI000484C433|nr:DUF2239 family protein [Deinococcus pimensis]
MEASDYTVFVNLRRLVTAPLPEALRVLKTSHDLGEVRDVSVLMFEDDTGRQVDFDLSGSLDDVLRRALPPEPRRGPGRPKLGVTAREVTLLPRHWEWLDRQRGGASAALRRLVDEARRASSGEEEARRAAEATSRFMTAVGGDLAGYEDASRALFAHEREPFERAIAAWPHDVREHALRLAEPVFREG